jgi:uncharacterized membrane protein YgdD (TMEM256/DUF423 family)
MNFLRISFVSMAIAVTLGALGAHALKVRIPADSLSSWHTAVTYQVYHSLAMMVLSSGRLFRTEHTKLPLILMFFGVVLFSGSIYFLSTKILTGLPVAWLGPVTPIGGLLMIGAWILLGIRASRLRIND